MNPTIRSRISASNGKPEVVNPTLLPITRTFPFIDYEALSNSDKILYNKMAENFIETENVASLKSESYFKLMCVLREKRREFCLKFQTLLADRIDTLMQRLSVLFLERKLYNSKAEMVAAIKLQLEIEENQLKSMATMLHSDYANLLDAREKAINKVNAECEQRMSVYDNSIPEKLPPEYRKLSSELLNLRQVEKSLIGSRRYKEADKIHREFLKKQKQELEQQRIKYYQSFEKERKRIETRNKRATQAVVVQWERKVEKMKEEMENKLHAKRCAIDNLKHKLVSAEAEYIGEDDPIVREEEVKPFPGRLPLQRKENVRQTTYNKTQKMRLSNRRLERERLNWRPFA